MLERRLKKASPLIPSRLVSLQAQLAAKRFLSEEELRVQALMEVEKALQHEMHRLREQIRSLAKQDY